jgi:hypothetical protein
MFSKPYQGVKHFGHFVEEAADQYGRRDAMAVLADAVQRCIDEDMRTAEVFAALDYLAASATRQWPFQQFRRSLDMTNPDARWQNCNASYNAILRTFNA